MKQFLKFAAIAAAITMFASAAAEAQGGGAAGGGTGGARGGGQGRGGRGGPAGMVTAEGVTADSAYAIMFAGITLEPAKKTAVMPLITKYQADMRANPAPARGGGGGGARGGGGAAMTAADSATMLANQAITTKRNGFTSALRVAIKAHLTPAQVTTFDATFPEPGAGRGRGGF